jgi:ABC-2 type transport system ATP-binding protein
MIAATSLTRVFDGVAALRDVTLTIEPGEMFALIGPAGAGKTTFFRIVSGLLHPTSGRLTTAGVKTIGVVPQRFSLYPDLSIDENLTLRAKLYDIDAATAKARAGELLERAGLADLGPVRAGDLSAGMQQKLALVAALLTKPDLLLLDEPTTGVDPVSRREFWQILHELHHEGLTIVVATSYMDEAEYATRVAFLDRGRLLDVGTRAEILDRYARALVEVHTRDRVKVASLPGEARRALDGIVAADAVIPIQPSLGDVFVLQGGRGRAVRSPCVLPEWTADGGRTAERPQGTSARPLRLRLRLIGSHATSRIPNSKFQIIPNS